MYTPILATLGYVLSPDGKKVLLIHRNARPDDAHLGKYNGLGGKLEPDEDIISGMKRELREEAGIEVEVMQFRGTVNWPGFGRHEEGWLAFIFLIERFSGEPHASNPEGTLDWVPIDKVMDLPLWESDQHFVPLVFDRRVGMFHGVMRYQGTRPAGDWSCTTLPAKSENASTDTESCR